MYTLWLLLVAIVLDCSWQHGGQPETEMANRPGDPVPGETG